MGYTLYCVTSECLAATKCCTIVGYTLYGFTRFYLLSCTSRKSLGGVVAHQADNRRHGSEGV